jgi:hypothetical protein
MLPMLAQAQGEVWRVEKKIDEMTDEAKIWICGAKPAEANEALFEMRSVFCAVCETKGRRGYACHNRHLRQKATKLTPVRFVHME